MAKTRGTRVSERVRPPKYVFVPVQGTMSVPPEDTEEAEAQRPAMHPSQVPHTTPHRSQNCVRQHPRREQQQLRSISFPEIIRQPSEKLQNRAVPFEEDPRPSFQ